MTAPVSSVNVTQYGTFEQVAASHLAVHPALPIITVEELLRFGATMAIGAAVNEDGSKIIGEVIMIDGHVYVTQEGCELREMRKDEKLCYVQFANMPPEGTITQNIENATPEQLVAFCKERLGETGQHAFALRLNGTFKKIEYRGISHGENGHESFDAMQEKASKVAAQNIELKLSGLFQEGLPDGKANAGWHLHASNPDHSSGGHVNSFEGFTGTVEMIPVHEWLIQTKEAACKNATCKKQACAKLIPANNIQEVYRFNAVGADLVQRA